MYWYRMMANPIHFKMEKRVHVDKHGILRQLGAQEKTLPKKGFFNLIF
jgi:hypothetical protein